MKSLQNITKETACYRGKEITHGIGYDSFMLELNKLHKKFGRVVDGTGNSNTGFNVEKAFVDYLGREAHSAHASYDAVGHDGKKWEIRTRNFLDPATAIHFMASSVFVLRPWKRAGQGESFDYIEKKCAAVDMFLVADSSRVGEKGLIEWWEIPSKAIIELHNRDEWQQGKVKSRRGGRELGSVRITRFLQTMKWIFNK